MGTYAGAEQTMVSEWVEGRLLARAADLDALMFNGTSVGALSARIFEDAAEPGTPYPFIIYQCQSPPRDVRGVGLARVMVDTMYVVKAVAQCSSYRPLGPVASLIDNILTTADGGHQGNGSVFTCVREEQFALVEPDGGKQYRHLGGLYKIQAQG